MSLAGSLLERTLGGNVARIGMTALAVGVAATALNDARNLYNRREGMAGQFQEEITFPFDLIREDSGRNFYMGFTFQKYVKRSIKNSPFLRTQGKIRLPIPDGIKDNMSVSYSDAALGAGVGAALENITGGDFGSLISSATSTGGVLVGGAQGFAVDAISQSFQQVSEGVQALSGMAVNPYQTVLFKNPNFKNHNFSWRFMPRDEDESNRVRNIFRTFQFHMLPGVDTSSGIFFSYPSMVIVSLFPSSEFLYRFKPCVVKSVNIDYSAGSSPSFFRRTAAPTSMSISIELQEIEYWTNNDYTAAALSDDAQLRGSALQAAAAALRAAERAANTPPAENS